MAAIVIHSRGTKKSDNDRPLDGRQDRSKQSWKHAIFMLLEAFHWELHYIMHGISIRALMILMDAGGDIAQERKRKMHEHSEQPGGMALEDFPEEPIINLGGFGGNFFTDKNRMK